MGREMQRAGLDTGYLVTLCVVAHPPVAESAIRKRRVSFHAAVALLIILACASPIYAQSPILDRAVDLANGSALVAHSADLASTTYCLAAKTCQEANPLLLPHVKSPVRFFALKMGVALGSYVVKTKTKRTHPKLTLAFALAENVGFFWIAHRNYQVHKGHQ